PDRRRAGQIFAGQPRAKSFGADAVGRARVRAGRQSPELRDRTGLCAALSHGEIGCRRRAQRVDWGLLFIPISAAFFFIGTALFAFYRTQPELLPVTIAAAAQPDAVFPHYISHQLPT